jgi:hypothetical protein
MNKLAEDMFESCKNTAQTHGTMTLTMLLNEAMGADVTQEKDFLDKHLEVLKKQVNLSVKLRDKEA